MPARKAHITGSVAIPKTEREQELAEKAVENGEVSGTTMHMSFFDRKGNKVNLSVSAVIVEAKQFALHQIRQGFVPIIG